MSTLDDQHEIQEKGLDATAEKKVYWYAYIMFFMNYPCIPLACLKQMMIMSPIKAVKHENRAIASIPFYSSQSPFAIIKSDQFLLYQLHPT